MTQQESSRADTPTDAGRCTGANGPRVLGPLDGHAVDLRSLGVRVLAWSEATGGDFALVEHPIPPRTLVAPLHRHEREDEYSFVLEGVMGADLGGEVVFARRGLRLQAPAAMAHLLERRRRALPRSRNHSPGGFERFFSELAELMAATGVPNPGVALAGSELPERFAIEFKPESIDERCLRHGLIYPSAKGA